MNYVKAIFVGVIASVLTSIVYIVLSIGIMLRRYPPSPGAEVEFDLRSLFFGTPTFWLVALLAFVFGFWWVIRRAMR